MIMFSSMILFLLFLLRNTIKQEKKTKRVFMLVEVFSVQLVQSFVSMLGILMLHEQSVEESVVHIDKLHDVELALLIQQLVDYISLWLPWV